MFVTVWLGILEISTGRLTTASAGHEYPMINLNGKYELLKDEHGMAIGFWMDVCRRRLNADDLLIQNSMETLFDLIEASSLPHFTSDRILERTGPNPDRVTIPIEDSDAKTTYYIACLNSEKKKYGAVFSAAREAVLRNR